MFDKISIGIPKAASISTAIAASAASTNLWSLAVDSFDIFSMFDNGLEIVLGLILIIFEDVLIILMAIAVMLLTAGPPVIFSGNLLDEDKNTRRKSNIIVTVIEIVAAIINIIFLYNGGDSYLVRSIENLF